MPRSRKNKPGMKVRRSKCKSCVFRPESQGGVPLTEARRLEIHTYLLNGTNQLCHHDDSTTICRGGRDFQLNIWCRLGLIEAPTDEALRKAMREHGFKPGDHI